MATVLLVRHGRTTANAAGVLSGRQPGIELDEVGRAQVARTAERLASVPLVAAISSPLERCRQTSGLLLERRSDAPPLELDEGIVEADYGDWQGRKLSDLAKEPLWTVVQQRPSEAVFPGGESLEAMQVRAVAAIRRRDEAITAEHGPDAVWVAVSHADIIKAILADALGMQLDQFQRIVIGPASISIVRYGAERPEVLATNSTSGELEGIAPQRQPGAASSAAAAS